MDTYEATKIVLSRIQSLDPENASRITGYILIQDQGEKEMIRLAFSPESLLMSYVNQAKACLGLPSNGCSTPSTPSSPSPFTNNNSSCNNPMSNPGSRPNPFSQTSPRIIIPNNNRFHLNNPSSPSSPWSSRTSRSASYAAVVNGSTNTASGSSSSSLSLPFFNNNSSDLSDELGNIQVQDQLSFLDDSLDPIVSPSGRSDSVLFPYGNCDDNPNQHHHRRSCSVNDVFLGGSDDGGGGGNGGFGWRPCLYFARGFCKNGTTCKFLHSGGGGAGFGAGDSSPDVPGPMVGSPSKIDGFDELIRLKAIQQQRFAAAQQLMASGAPPPFAFNKCMNFLNDSPRSAAASLMMSDEFHKFGRCRPERSEFSAMGLGGSASSASRQIYLTFPADSTFKEEDVSNYFSMYGPVQDVRIPYQQKRMFGFVTFVYPETVKLILAKGNPHFVCDSRVLVKPYKEKGKVPEKKHGQQQPHLDREFSGCLSPSGLDSREPFDLPFGARMFYNTQEMMLRRKLEQEAELQQAIELQGRRLMSLQLMDMKNHHHGHQFQPGSFPGVTVSPTTLPQSQANEDLHLPSERANLEVSEDLNINQEAANSPPVLSDEQFPEELTKAVGFGNDSGNKEESSKVEHTDARESSLENALPDNLFASPTKSAADLQSAFAPTSAGGDDVSSMKTSSSSSAINYIPMLPPTSTLSMASLKSCYFQMPRFSSGQEATEI
ncbi:OLC1v1005359C2 [Oldenlandia corymbosa var. corymbosa]|uniref:OLC1v1005359C2 n=1 Tax=Oldenlandia corymbosa var. corymbosa TaxID=529605 RepID=A0AAV1DEF0_OLDCO|nr:OLC1v1005359C2 [Oldenlandia corymbosa var. corymbosa]